MSIPVKTYTLLTLAIAVLVISVSSAGIFVDDTYAKEARSWALQAIGQDIVNIISIPIFIAAGFFAAKDSVRGSSIWLGILLFLIYAFVIYSFDVQYNSLFLAYVAVLGLSFYAFLRKIMSVNPEGLQKHFSINTKVKHVSIFLMIIAILFYFQRLGQDIPAILTNDAPQDVKEIGIPTNPVHVLDLGFFLSAMLITSILL